MLAGHGTRPPVQVARFLYLAMALSLLAASAVSMGPVGVAQAEGPNAIQGPSDVTGCTANSLGAIDDVPSATVQLPFTLNFFGTNRSTVFVNNNGNVTFDEALGTFTPFNLASTNRVIIAPFFADVDTQGAGSGVATYGAGTYQGRPSFCVNWINVGYFNDRTDKLNSFQLILVSRADRGVGDFDIIFNYDKVQWETGSALSSGGTNGLGGNSARVGYSNGTPAGSFELQGSGVPGSFINGGPRALISGSNNSGGQQGRYRFEVINGLPPTGATVTGRVTDPNQTGVPDSLVSICSNALARCLNAFTGPTGQYSIPNVPDATDWGLVAFPPATGPFSTLFSAERFIYTVQNGQLVLQPGQDTNLVLTAARRPRAGVTIGPPLLPGVAADSVVSTLRPLVITAMGPAGCGADYTITQGGLVIASNKPASAFPPGSIFPPFIQGGEFVESPPGTFTATLPPLNPHHGPATVTIDWRCPQPPDDVIDIYLDPSGVVKTTTGAPIAGATVTLFRSDSAAGPFTVVPNGSILMSPSNRRNPDTTDAVGFYHWDVMPGFYKVRAEKAGCVSPTNPAQTFVESDVLPVPPIQLNIDLILNCAGAATPTTGPTNIGGRNLKLTSQSPTSARLDWTDGTTETGYLIIRWSPTAGFFFPPAGAPIPGSNSSFTDSPLAAGPSCYVLLPVGGNPPSTTQVLGLSDMACIYAGSGAGTGAATQFAVRLGANNQAQLSWTAPSVTQSHYFLLVTKFDGTPPQASTLSGSPTSATHDTNGTSTCYTLVAANGPRVNGYTDTLCIVPGLNTLGSPSASSVQSVDDVTDRIRQTVDSQVRER